MMDSDYCVMVYYTFESPMLNNKKKKKRRSKMATLETSHQLSLHCINFLTNSTRLMPQTTQNALLHVTCGRPLTVCSTAIIN